MKGPDASHRWIQLAGDERFIKIKVAKHFIAVLALERPQSGRLHHNVWFLFSPSKN
ncbi:MAG: hypothetical protein H0X02_11965 [Nitrosomonas sp.]|nr:hypothetical protein [Nitrosomonas sp.]